MRYAAAGRECHAFDGIHAWRLGAISNPISSPSGLTAELHFELETKQVHLPASLLVVFGSLLLLGCSESRNSTGSISKRIGEIVHTPGSTEVDLGKLTIFGWEYFYAFKPGTTRDEVCQFIKAARSVCGRIVRIEKAPDDHMFLIFGLNGQLTHIELHAVENGRFDMQFNEQGFPRAKSVFKVRHSSSGTDKDTVFLEPR